jgi:hypothetical protein
VGRDSVVGIATRYELDGRGIEPIPVAVRPRAWVFGSSLTTIVGSNPPIPVAVRSKAWVFGRSLARIMGSNPTGGMDVCVVCLL